MAAETEYKFDLSDFSAMDFMVYGDLGRRIAELQEIGNLFGGAMMPGTALSVVFDLLRFAGKFADGYTLDDVPSCDTQRFLGAFVDVMGKHLAGGGDCGR